MSRTEEERMAEQAFLQQMIFVNDQTMAENRQKGIHKYYLFLDFDGVINVFYLPGTPEYEEMVKMEEFEFADRRCVARLQALCRDYPIEVIISSSWRFSGLKNCIEYLRKAGLSEDTPIVDVTQGEKWQTRESDIHQYLYEHPDFSGYIVFDDMRMPHIPGHMVQTDPLKGWDAERDAYARTLLDQQK